MEDEGSVPGSGRSPGGGNGNPLQYPCLESPWTEKPGGLQSTESKRVRHDWATEHAWSFTVCIYARDGLRAVTFSLYYSLRRWTLTWTQSSQVGKVSNSLYQCLLTPSHSRHVPNSSALWCLLSFLPKPLSQDLQLFLSTRWAPSGFHGLSIQHPTKSGPRCDSSRGLFVLKACATYAVSSLQ